MRLSWVPGSELTVRFDGDEVVILGNAAGLRSLASHLEAVAAAEGRGAHLHLDEHNGLGDGSAALRIERA